MTTYLGTSTSTVVGIDGASATSQVAVRGISTGTANGIYGRPGDGYAGVFGSCISASGTGVYGYGPVGVWGWDAGSGVAVLASGSDTGWGVSAYGLIGVQSVASVAGGIGVHGTDGGFGAGTYGGVFDGDVDITGNLTKGGGGFLIDHPLDPANRHLEHSFVESPERRNVYEGIGVADGNGEFQVQLPSYFDALNEDCRYQLTPIGAPAPTLHIKEEISKGRFVVGGAAALQKVSWQVTGRRKDPWAQANPLRVEHDKTGKAAGRYRHPECHGQPSDRAVRPRTLERRPNKPVDPSP